MRKYDNKKVCASLWNYAANVAEQARQENDQVAIYRAFKHIVQSMLRDYVSENVCDFEELADHALFVMDRERRSLRSAAPQLYDAMLQATSEFFELHQDFYFEIDMEDLL